MRVTDQVTNQVAADTGIAVNANSLANVGASPTGNALLDELNKSDNNKAGAITKNRYEEIKKSADELLETAQEFLEEGSSSLLAALDTEEGRTKLKEQLARLVDGFNKTGDRLKTSENSLDAYYLQMLMEVAGDNAAELAKLGISVSPQGKLQYDSSKTTADADTVKDTLGAQSDFMQKLAFISEHISDNASAGIKNLGNTYNSYGTANASPAFAGSFDFRR